EHQQLQRSPASIRAGQHCDLLPWPEMARPGTNGHPRLQGDNTRQAVMLREICRFINHLAAYFLQSSMHVVRGTAFRGQTSVHSLEKRTVMPLSFANAISAVSVRDRIIGLALIPVIGFLANGIAFTSGQSEVTDAFANVATAATLADASREFKIALA